MTGSAMGDVERRLVEVLRAHLPRDRYDDDGHSVRTYCTCGEWEGDYFADGEAGPFDDHLAAAIVASGLLAEVAADARREALQEAADALRKKAVAEFDHSGPHSPRGAAIWDSACAINPDYGDILGSSAARSGPRADCEAASHTPEGGR